MVVQSVHSDCKIVDESGSSYDPLLDDDGLNELLSSFDCESEVTKVLVLYSSSPVGTRKIAIPFVFLEVEHPTIEQLAPGIA